MWMSFWLQEQVKLLSVVNAKFEQIFALWSCTLQHSGTRMRNNIFFISINEKQSLKGVIQNEEYEVGVFQIFFYIAV